MIAYDRLWLKNLFVRQQAAEAFDQACIDKAELENVHTAYPLSFYSPNLFIRVGLFLLTVVILLFSFGLVILLFLDSIDHAIGGMAIFFALLSYAALEYMVKTKRHLQSGVDDALLWVSAGSFFGGISYLTNAGALANSIIIFLISFYCILRFADKLMSLVCYVSTGAICFYTCTGFGMAARAFIPFLLMFISGVTYFLVQRIRLLPLNHLYCDCLQVILISALLGFYFSGNYFVVREFSNEMFHLNLAEQEGIPFGWIFWVFTIVTPLAYLARGIQKKDVVLIRVGLVLVAAIVFTLRYYYAVFAVEGIMTITGILLIIISYGLTRYLATPRYGFSNVDPVDGTGNEKLQIESILQAQTFAGKEAAADGTRFGGGSFGGGGTSGDF